jgi:hypothetical protein
MRKGETASDNPLAGTLWTSPVMIRRSVFLSPDVFVFQLSAVRPKESHARARAHLIYGDQLPKPSPTFFSATGEIDVDFFCVRGQPLPVF